MDYSFLEAFFFRVYRPKEEKRQEQRRRRRQAKIAIQDEFSFWMERGQGSRCPIAGTISRDVDRFLELPPLSTAYGIPSGVPRPEFA